MFSGLRYGTYYLKELQAPEGYQRSNEVSKIVLDEKIRRHFRYGLDQRREYA